MARGAGLDEVRLGVELCTVYWHYLLLVWLVLFSLLLLYLNPRARAYGSGDRDQRRTPGRVTPVCPVSQPISHPTSRPSSCPGARR